MAARAPAARPGPETDPDPAEVTVKVTRAEQRLATRSRLIDATFGLLVERGYANTSTALVAERAGVSHGALFNHFGSRDELMVACIEEVFPRFMAEGSERLLALATTDQRPLDRVVDLLWEQFCGATMMAMRELMMAARTNDTMSAALTELDAILEPANVALAGLLVPEMAGHPQLPALVGLTLAAVDGAAFASQAFRNPDRHAASKVALVQALELLVADALARPSAPSTEPSPTRATRRSRSTP